MEGLPVGTNCSRISTDTKLEGGKGKKLSDKELTAQRDTGR